MPIIRPATPEDIGPITEIYNEAIQRTVATFDTVPRSLANQTAWFFDHQPRYPVLAAEVDGRVAGWASLSRWSERPAYDGTAEVSVYIAEGHRGRGIGRALLQALVEEGKGRGFHTLVSRIVEGSGASIHLHEALGFTHVGVLREAGRKFGRLLDVTIMQLIL